MKENKFLNLIRRGVNAKYSVPAWLFAMISCITGLLILFVSIFDPAGNVIFLSALPLGGLLMGPFIALAAFAALYGMAKHKTQFVKYGAFASFCCWIFVSTAFYASGGFITVLLLPIWMLIFWAYKYLASHVRELDGI